MNRTGFYTWEELADILEPYGINYAAFLRMGRDGGGAPKPFRLTRKSPPRWPVAAINDWFRQRGVTIVETLVEDIDGEPGDIGQISGAHGT